MVIHPYTRTRIATENAPELILYVIDAKGIVVQSVDDEVKRLSDLLCNSSIILRGLVQNQATHRLVKVNFLFRIVSRYNTIVSRKLLCHAIKQKKNVKPHDA